MSYRADKYTLSDILTEGGDADGLAITDANIDGTTSTTFKFDSDASSHFMLKNDSGVARVRNKFDNDDASLIVKDLTVNGTVTTVNSNEVNIADSVILLNADETGVPTQDGGIQIERGTSTNASLIWDEGSDVWKAGLDTAEIELVDISSIQTLTNKSLTASEITDFDTEVSNNTSVAAATTHIANTSNPHDTTLQQAIAENANFTTSLISDGNATITSLPSTPVNDNDATSKIYTQLLANAQTVDLATTEQVIRVGSRTVDGTNTATETVLVWQQTDPSQNGVFQTGPSTWTRLDYADTDQGLRNKAIFVKGGTQNAGKIFINTNTSTITPDTTNITYSEVAYGRPLKDLWETLPIMGVSTSNSGSYAYDGADTIYVIRGGGVAQFYKYSFKTGIWTQLADVTVSAVSKTFNSGAFLIYDGADALYAHRGSSTTEFLKYTISTATWSSMTASPGSLTTGATATYDGTNFIYVVVGNNTTTFYRYSISANTWATMAATPNAMSTGNSMVYTGDYIYVPRGNTTTDFYRYSIRDNVWSSMAALPATKTNLSAAVYDGWNYIYFVGGANENTKLNRYNIKKNSWTYLTDITSNITTGPGAIYTNDGCIYWFVGGTIWYRYYVGTQAGIRQLPEQPNTPGVLRVSAQFDKTNNTLADVTGLSFFVNSGKFYTFKVRLYTTSDIAAGVKAAIAGTATATAIIYEGMTYSGGTITQTRATALATAVGAVTVVTAAYIEIKGTITVNVSGTLTVQFAQNVTNAAASSVLIGSIFELQEVY